MFKKIIRYYKLFLFRKLWRKKNLHNFTYAKNIFQQEQVTIGKCTYGPIELLSDVPSSKLKIGSFCSIGEDTIFLLGKDHVTHNLSTYPFRYKILKSVKYESVSKGDIIVENDVWFGQRTTVLSGVKIGQGAVIATGAVVTKDVPPYAIVGGCPAKVLKYRFDDEVIKKLLTLNFDNLSEETLKQNEEYLYTKITYSNVDMVLKKLENI